MGKQWDGGDIAFRPELWAEVLRVLRPGGYMVAFASTRGYHRMVCAIEDAGFTIHPMLAWINGQGFPKAHKVNDPPICLAQKPFSEKTGTANVLKHGTGAINVDGCRVETGENLNGGAYAAAGADRDSYEDWRFKRTGGAGEYVQPAGRWPANVCHDGSDEVLEAFARFGERNGGHHPAARGKGNISTSGHAGQVDLIERHADSGTAARFFYEAKASKAERGAGNSHPTVKPLALMRWLCRLITAPGGTVLDPFLGSGSTAIAACQEGFSCIGIEREAEYMAIARARIAADAPLFAEVG
jgi:site-specific DNA-methyltransferase (adenine-specific)